MSQHSEYTNPASQHSEDITPASQHSGNINAASQHSEYLRLAADAIGKFRSTHPGKKFRAALVDMDGTLYDSMRNHTSAWHRMVSELGISADRDSFYLYEGMTGRQTINYLFNLFLHRDATPQECEELYKRKTQYFNELPAVGPMPGAQQLLASLKENGVKIVLVTGSGQRSLIDRLNRDFPGIFTPDLMITSYDVVHGKPDPEPYLKAMEKVQVAQGEAFVVENAPLGVKAGAASGAFTIGLTTGPIPPEKLAEAGADLVLPSMPALAQISELLTL